MRLCNRKSPDSKPLGNNRFVVGVASVLSLWFAAALDGLERGEAVECCGERPQSEPEHGLLVLCRVLETRH
jgi:hypothetical protein